MNIGKVFSNIIHSERFLKHLDKSISEPKYLARTLLATSVSKDVFAYVLRVNSARKNQEIPPDKRKYVVKMDAVTGITTAIVQLLTGFIISNEKLQNAIANRLFKPIVNNTREFKHAKCAFSALSTMVIATLFAKRIVVPYIASELTSSKMLNDESIKRYQTFLK